jgi:hypothetical protein
MKKLIELTIKIDKWIINALLGMYPNLSKHMKK